MFDPPALPFASLYGYSPGGVGGSARLSRLLCARLKAGDTACLRKSARRVRLECGPGQPLAALFAGDPILVPVPTSSAGAGYGGSAPERVCAALRTEGLGGATWSGLSRITAVRRSATAHAGSRPTVEDHYRSFVVAGIRPGPGAILLVDDVITKGRTLLAAAARLQEAFPEARIGAFALLRTMSLVPEIESVLQPCAGEIRWRRGDAHRIP